MSLALALTLVLVAFTLPLTTAVIIHYTDNDVAQSVACVTIG